MASLRASSQTRNSQVFRVERGVWSGEVVDPAGRIIRGLVNTPSFGPSRGYPDASFRKTVPPPTP